MTDSYEFNGRIQAINSVNIVARVTAFLDQQLFTARYRRHMQPAIRDAMIAAIPQLRRFAVRLTGPQQADDLVQQTLLKACSKIRSFDSTSPILPWLIAILRNQFYSECRKRGREVEDVDGIYSSTLVTGPNQIAHAELKDLDAALLKLPDEMRKAVIAVGWEGLSYQDAARAFDCPVGTVRSRVHRARESLAALLDIERTAALAGRLLDDPHNQAEQISLVDFRQCGMSLRHSCCAG